MCIGNESRDRIILLEFEKLRTIIGALLIRSSIKLNQPLSGLAEGYYTSRYAHSRGYDTDFLSAEKAPDSGVEDPMSVRRIGLVYILAAIVCFVVALFYALRISPVYTTNALLIPKEQTPEGAASGLATATKLLGLGTGGAQSSNFEKFQKYWGSRDVAEQLLKDHPGLLRQLFAADWDKQHGRWYQHAHTLRQIIAIPLNSLFGVYPDYAPSTQDLAEIIKSGMKLDLDPMGEQIQINYTSSDAKFAQWFLGAVIAATDEAVRKAEQRRDQDFVNFSTERLQRETNVSYRDALTDAVRQFEISSMYSEAGDHFSFQYVEAPGLPLVHSAPRPLLYTVVAFIFANLVATTLVTAILLWPESRFTRSINRFLTYLSCLFSWGGAFKKRRATQGPAF